MTYILLSEKDMEIAKKYNIDANRAHLVTLAKREKPYVIEEMDFLHENTNIPSNYKRIVAYDIEKTKNGIDKYLLAELDYMIKTHVDGRKTFEVEDYGYVHPLMLRHVLYYLENQAINANVSEINLHEREDEDYMFETDGYDLVNASSWQKTQLEIHKFNGSYMELDCKIEEDFEEIQSSDDTDERK